MVRGAVKKLIISSRINTKSHRSFKLQKGHCRRIDVGPIRDGALPPIDQSIMKCLEQVLSTIIVMSRTSDGV